MVGIKRWEIWSSWVAINHQRNRAILVSPQSLNLYNFIIHHVLLCFIIVYIRSIHSSAINGNITMELYRNICVHVNTYSFNMGVSYVIGGRNIIQVFFFVWGGTMQNERFPVLFQEPPACSSRKLSRLRLFCGDGVGGGCGNLRFTQCCPFIYFCFKICQSFKLPPCS